MTSGQTTLGPQISVFRKMNMFNLNCHSYIHLKKNLNKEDIARDRLNACSCE